MALLSPLFLLGALSAIVPIVLHLLKRRPEAVVRFAAVKLLQTAPVEHASRRQLRQWLLLALRVAAVLLAAFAFARPFLTSADASSADALVVAIDTSFSMSGPERFERARALSLEAIDGAPVGTAIAVVAFDDTARVISQMSLDRARARTAVGALQPSFGATRYNAAVAAARDLLRGRPGRLTVVSDLQARGWDVNASAALPETVSVDVVDIGAPARNLGVTSLRVAGGQLVASVRNSSSTTIDVHARLDVGATVDRSSAQTVAERRLPIEPMHTADFTFPAPDGRWASVAVDDPDGPSADNVRYVLLDGTSRRRVLVVTTTGVLGRDAFYVEQALISSASSSAAEYEAVGVAASGLAVSDATRLDSGAALIVASTRGLEHRGRELIRNFIARGGGALIPFSADVDADVVSEVLGGMSIVVVPPASGTRRAVTLTPSDSRHPVLRSFLGSASLGLVQFAQAFTIRAESCTTLARLTSGVAALIECESGKGRVLLFASDLDNRGNDFPRHATFLPFLHEAVRYLSAGGTTADYLIGAVPAGVAAIPGIAAQADDKGDGQRLIAVNVDPDESDPSRLTPLEFERAITRTDDVAAISPQATARAREAEQHLWQYVLAAVLLVLAVESLVASRTT